MKKLLCTNKGHKGAMVTQPSTGIRKTMDSKKVWTVSPQLAFAPEKRPAGMGHLFVSKYQPELPRKEEIERFLEEQMRPACHDGHGAGREVGNGD